MMTRGEAALAVASKAGKIREQNSGKNIPDVIKYKK